MFLLSLFLLSLFSFELISASSNVEVPSDYVAKRNPYYKRSNDNEENEDKKCPVELIKNTSSTWITWFNSGSIAQVVSLHDPVKGTIQAPGLGGALTVGSHDIHVLLANVYDSGLRLNHLSKRVYCPCKSSFVEVTTLELTYPGGSPVTTFNLNQGEILKKGSETTIRYGYNNFANN